MRGDSRNDIEEDINISGLDFAAVIFSQRVCRYVRGEERLKHYAIILLSSSANFMAFNFYVWFIFPPDIFCSLISYSFCRNNFWYLSFYYSARAGVRNLFIFSPLVK